jgi:hypothetical protein
MSLQDFIERSTEVHGGKYDYSRINKLCKLHDKVCIICPKHGEFWQVAYDHLGGHGCNKCGQNETKTENELYDFISNLLGEDKIIRNDRKILNGKEIDILIPELNLGFEYNGLRWHSEKFGKDKRYHISKLEECE